MLTNSNRSSTNLESESTEPFIRAAYSATVTGSLTTRSSIASAIACRSATGSEIVGDGDDQVPALGLDRPLSPLGPSEARGHLVERLAQALELGAAADRVPTRASRSPSAILVAVAEIRSIATADARPAASPPPIAAAAA